MICANKKCMDYDDDYDDHCGGCGIRYDGHLCSSFIPQRDDNSYININDFEKELTTLINKYSVENGSDTPDFILAKYILGCLSAFNSATKDRESWYGRGMIERVKNLVVNDGK